MRTTQKNIAQAYEHNGLNDISILKVEVKWFVGAP